MLCAVAAEFREAAAAVVLTVVEEEVADCAARDINVGRSWTATPVRLRSFALPFRGGSTTLLVVVVVVVEGEADCAARDINVGRSLTATPVRLRSLSFPFPGGSKTLLVVDVIVAIVVEGETDCALFCAKAALSFRRATSSRVMEVAAMVALPPEHTTAR